MLALVYRKSLNSQTTRRRWWAHAAFLVIDDLKELPLVRRDAAEIDTTHSSVPPESCQMEIFILESMKQLRAAEVMPAGLLANRQVTAPRELRFLEECPSPPESASRCERA